MSTTQQIRPTAVHTHERQPIPVCGCGQDLDCCGGGHCPRCGRTLHGVPALASAA